jgi:hypothetical protein
MKKPENPLGGPRSVEEQLLFAISMVKIDDPAFPYFFGEHFAVLTAALEEIAAQIGDLETIDGCH